MRIYFDNAATTPMHPEVIQEMSKLMEEVYGNPSSIHQSGRIAKTIVENARKTIANILNCSIGEIFFTGSATEANNMVIRKAVSDLGVKKIIISAIEHPCVLITAVELQKNGDVDLEILPVNGLGLVNLHNLEDVLNSSKEKTLVSIMHVNNELGIMQDIFKIAKICKSHNALFHCDAVQSIAKLPFDLEEIEIDFLSATAHKFHGPKGVGFMYINADHKINPFITGGGQERNMRSGTENVHGIAGLAKAMQLYTAEGSEKINKINNLKKQFKSRLKEILPDVSFIEDERPADFIPTILSASFPSNDKTDLMTFNLDIAGIAASAGSACASGVEQASHVLEAIKFAEDRRAVRFSFSFLNTLEEVEACIQKIKGIFNKG